MRELQRQVSSLYYERTGMSRDKNRLAGTVQEMAEPASSAQVIRDPYVFEFLGLKSHEAVSESGLEGMLPDRLWHFFFEPNILG